MSDLSFSEALKRRGLVNAIPATEDLSDPDERMLIAALNDYLRTDFPTWSVELRSLEPFKLEVVALDRAFSGHLAGTLVGTPRDRARTAVVRAFASIVSRLSVRSLKFDPAQSVRLTDPGYLQTVLSLRLPAVWQVLARRIEKHGYAGLLRADVLPVAEKPKS